MVAGGIAVRSKNAALPEGSDHAGFGSRLFSYFIDSLVLFIFTVGFAIVSFLNIFLQSDSGNENPSDATIWASVIILMLTAPAWLLLNLYLGLRRGQTVGQYVTGLGVAKDDGSLPGLARLVVYWLALHPVFFHPLLAWLWLLFAYVSISLSASLPVLIASGAMSALCLLGPLANLFFALADPERRGIHDRVAGLKVVRIA